MTKLFMLEVEGTGDAIQVVSWLIYTTDLTFGVAKKSDSHKVLISFNERPCDMTMERLNKYLQTAFIVAKYVEQEV